MTAPEAPTAAKGAFPYPHRTVAEVDRICRICGEPARPCAFTDCPHRR